MPVVQTDIGRRIGEFMDLYTAEHERLIKVPYVSGNPQNDYHAAKRIVEAVSDDQLIHKAMIVWLGCDDAFAVSGTRTVPKFASRITWCLEILKKKRLA